MRWQVARGNIIFSKKYFVSLAEKRKVPLRLFEKLSFLRIHQAQNSPSQISTYRPSCPSSMQDFCHMNLVQWPWPHKLSSTVHPIWYTLVLGTSTLCHLKDFYLKKKKVYYSPQLSVHISEVDLYDNLFIGQEKSVCCLH